MTHDERDAAVLGDCLVRFIAKAQMSNKATLYETRRYLSTALAGTSEPNERELLFAAIGFLDTEACATIREDT